MKRRNLKVVGAALPRTEGEISALPAAGAGVTGVGGVLVGLGRRRRQSLR